jgi:hypothetical protein
MAGMLATSRHAEGRAPAVMGFALCALSGFVVGATARQGVVFAGLIASLLLVAGLAGWILRGVR